MVELTPVQRVGDVWLKRDDLYQLGGVHGGKVRTCLAIAEHATGLTTACSRHSPQANIVATVAAHLGIPAVVFVPWSKQPLTPELEAAQANGAKVMPVKPGHTSVLERRAKDCALAANREQPGWRYVPFGMAHPAAVEQTAAQVANLPAQARRLVMPVGSGMSLAGVLWGLHNTGRADMPVLGVVVGADPTKRLDRYAPLMWAATAKLVWADVSYQAAVDASVGGVVLDPHYEAKCVRYLRPDDVFWIVGRRQVVE